MPAQPQPPFNPVITLTMTLDVFHMMQEIVAKRPFDEVCDVIMGFRGEVIPQVQAARQAYDAQYQTAQTPERAPPKLHLATEEAAN
jgi:hypothetical protein